MALKIDPWSFPDPEQDLTGETGPATIVLAGGCFWCTEAVYSEVDGVLSVRPGYAGDTEDKADYRTVCTGRTRHAEAIEIRYDPARITLGQILKLFFSIAHDPTQKDRQGADVGPQYRSAIFYANEDQRRIAAAYIAQIDKARLFDGPVPDDAGAAGGFLRGRGLSSRLRCPEPAAALHPGRGRAQGEEAARGPPQSAEGRLSREESIRCPSPRPPGRPPPGST